MSVSAVTLCAMESELPSTLRYLAGNQCGVVSRSQALRAGLTTDMIKFRLRSGRWRLMHRGVYATFTGVPGRGARLWAAVLAAGPGAMLSYQTAAELHGLVDKTTNPIHVTVPHERHVLAAEGVSLHRSGRAVEAMEQRPDELVLASVVKVQAQLVVAKRLGEHPGPGGVAVGYRLDQRGHQVALATEHPVDDDHVVSVGPRDGGRGGHRRGRPRRGRGARHRPDARGRHVGRGRVDGAGHAAGGPDPGRAQRLPRPPGRGGPAFRHGGAGRAALELAP